MKGMFYLTAAALLFAGCSSPKVRTAMPALRPEGPRYADPDEVRKLREEARENFARLREEHSGAPRPRTIARIEPVGEAAFSTETIYAAPVSYQERSGRRSMDEDAAERAREMEDSRWQSQQRAHNYRAFEAGYARQLGKKPSQLSADEREWVRNNFE
jgi:hypothetical protein